ncbi:hypothetical protein [Rhodovarius crocodyli]|uniref:hypothetical protein n=1 Tax=Rhodovarius crocodyli TaxID=1979269 RepID=UPI000FD753E5|nr:hypothetical protein [Rhodovarius crocodyli]
MHELVSSSKVRGLYPNPEISDAISEICFHYGVASTILFDNSPKKINENDRAYKLRNERYEYVESICKGNDLEIVLLKNRSLRNKIVHIDEHVEKELRKPDAGWLIDSAVDNRDEFTAPNEISVNFCRGYIVMEEKIIHFGYEMDVRRLKYEASSVISAVFHSVQRS